MTAPPAGAMTPQQLAERALELSRSEECVVISEVTTRANLRWANNTLTSNGISRSNQLTVVAISGGAAGIVSQEGLSGATIEQAVRAADHAAGTGVAAEDRMPLPRPGTDPERPGAGSAAAWTSPPAETSIRVFRDLAPALGEEFSRAEAAKELLFGFASHEARTTYLATSTGIRERHDQPAGLVELNSKSSDLSRSVWSGQPTEDFKDVDIAAMASGLTRRLEWARRQIDLPPGRYPTILPPSAVADFMVYLYWSANGREAHDGRSVFSRPGGGTRVGERLTDVPVTIRSDPRARSLGCTPFVVAHSSSPAGSVFDNGLPLVATDWVREGVLSALVHTRHSATLTGLPATPYVDNLIMEGPPDAAGIEEIVASSSERALLLTCLWYIRLVDPQTLLLTGLTRDGVYLVEGGEVVGAVNNFRFNESPVDLLSRISSIGNTERTLPREWSDYFTRAAMPSLRVEGFNMSSVSQAS